MDSKKRLSRARGQGQEQQVIERKKRKDQEKERKEKERVQMEIDRISTEMAGSFFMELIGDNMEIFVNIVNDMLKGACKISVGDLELSRANFVPKHVGRNVIFPRGQHAGEVHWVFQDESGTIHNPYTYKMQLAGSHQFCQSHALKLAYDYCSGVQLRETNVDKAYEELLNFWQILVNKLMSAPRGPVKKILGVVLDDIYEKQEEEPDQDIVRQIKVWFPRDIQGILDILKSEYATYTVPRWK